MPTSGDLKNEAWGKLKACGWMPAVSGFACIYLLMTLARWTLGRLGVANGWITETALADLVERLGGLAGDLPPALADLKLKLPQPWYQRVMVTALTFAEGVLEFGGAVLAVAVARGADARASFVFSGFARIGRTGWLCVLRTLYVLLWSLLLVVPGVMAFYSYRMAYFLLADHPDWSANRAISESKKLMHGHRMRLAWLDFSFILWHLIVLFTGGLAALFVTPYAQTTFAVFYEDLLDRAPTPEEET